MNKSFVLPVLNLLLLTLSLSYNPVTPEPQVGPKPFPKAQAATIATAPNFTPGMRTPMETNTLVGRTEVLMVDLTGRGESGPLACAGRQSRTGTGDRTGTAPRGKKETSLTWAPGRRSPKLRCGSWRPGALPRCSRPASPGLQTALGYQVRGRSLPDISA